MSRQGFYASAEFGFAILDYKPYVVWTMCEEASQELERIRIEDPERYEEIKKEFGIIDDR